MKEYQLTEADLKELQEWGYDLAEIENADRLVYSYENWLDPNGSPGPFPSGGWGIKANYLTETGKSATKGNGKLTLFILPESEGRKIEQRKEEIVEGFVVAYLQALISWFESQYEKSLEKKILVEYELKKVEKLLFEWNEDYRYHSYGDGLWLSFFTYANVKPGSMCDWYERFCVNGEDAKSAVSGHHSTMTANELSRPHHGSLHFVVAAFAFHRFKKYLASKLQDTESTAPQMEAQQINKLKEKALVHLRILSGQNVHGRKIMPDADFQRLQGYVEAMIEKGRVPDGLEPILQVQFPNGHIRYLFRCIHAEQYAERKIQDHFIDFIHAVFPSFSGKKEITKRKFGEQPTTWNADLEKMKGG